MDKGESTTYRKYMNPYNTGDAFLEPFARTEPSRVLRRFSRHIKNAAALNIQADDEPTQIRISPRGPETHK